jgi:hypothetical protein
MMLDVNGTGMGLSTPGVARDKDGNQNRWRVTVMLMFED